MAVQPRIQLTEQEKTKLNSLLQNVPTMNEHNAMNTQPVMSGSTEGKITLEQCQAAQSQPKSLSPETPLEKAKRLAAQAKTKTKTTAKAKAQAQAQTGVLTESQNSLRGLKAELDPTRVQLRGTENLPKVDWFYKEVIQYLKTHDCIKRWRKAASEIKAPNHNQYPAGVWDRVVGKTQKVLANDESLKSWIAWCLKCTRPWSANTMTTYIVAQVMNEAILKEKSKL